MRRTSRRPSSLVPALRAAAAAIVGALVCTLVVVSPANAATTPLSLRVVGGDRQITAAWPKVAAARAYTVHWGAGTSTAKVLHTTATSIRISGVTNAKSYSVRVTADGTSAASKRLTATPSPYAPVEITSVTAKPAGPNQIKVSWTGGGRARSFAVYVGSDSQTKVNHYATAWHPAAISSWTVNLPESLRGVLGAGTGSPIFVRVVQTNSTAAKPKMEWKFNGTTKFRLSTVGPWTISGAPAATTSGSKLTVASWNAQSISSTSKFSSGNQWSNRLPKVVRQLQKLAPAVVGFQELGTSRVDPACRNSPAEMTQGVYRCKEQYEDLADAVADVSSTVTTPYRVVRDDANAYNYQQQDMSKGDFVDSTIFYDPSAVSVVSSGFISPKAIMKTAWPSSYADEAGMWAEFRTNDGDGRRFLMASIHMPASGANLAAVQRAEGRQIAAWMSEKAAALGGIPVIITGDFNADGVVTRDAANLQMVAAGYTDAAATLDRTDIRWCTSNVTNGPDGADVGYPRTAVPHQYTASRIDYIMLKGGIASTRYRNELPLTRTSDGRLVFDSALQGSDHNMQVASLTIPGPAQS